jgi:CubicO group peptidase (beta-lactamase class C family)
VQSPAARHAEGAEPTDTSCKRQGSTAWTRWIVAAVLMLAASACTRQAPTPWEGPVLTRPRTQLTVDQLNAGRTPPFLDMSFFTKPDWSTNDAHPISGTISFAESGMVSLKERASYPGEDLFPRFAMDFIARDDALIPRERSLIDTRPHGDSYWDVIVGVGKVWREENDGEWSRASFPINLVARYVGEVRNCVGSFVYRADAMSRVAVQCSQETAVLDAQQLGDVRGAVPATYEPKTFADDAAVLAEYDRSAARRIPMASLGTIDRDGKIAAYFDKSIKTNASTSLGAVYLDGTLYTNPARTRHGIYPYPADMRHGVFSVTKSMVGALALFYFAERYGEAIFDAAISDYVPAFAGLPEWQGVTFSHALNMATGTRAGEDLLYEPLELAPDKEAAIRNIAGFGDFPEAPGEEFNYATTNTFVISYALENYVKTREGDGVHWWSLVHENVLEPIGAENFRVLLTRDEDPADRIPILGLGALPNLDEAAKIAVLIFNEGEHHGRQILNRRRIREALGRTDWRGYRIDSRHGYRHSFWSAPIRTGACRVNAVYMQGLGANHVIFLPSGVIVFRFMDEDDMNIDSLVRSVENVRSSCQ